MKTISILGSTGSIGTQCLDVIRANNDRFRVKALSCNENIELLAKEVEEFSPDVVCIGSEDDIGSLEAALGGIEHQPKIIAGEEGLEEIASIECDLVVNALVGMRGLVPTLRAIEQGTDIALANKETLVVGGHLVMDRARDKNVKILPIDSEHSAIFQCIEGNRDKKVKSIILTASGGPFREYKKEELYSVTPDMALKHPNWVMGKKITIDSATMMNKGLEIIEAKWLFDVPVERIRVAIHPQSIIHSGVEFEDSAILAQMGTPDMRVPISYALAYPDRLPLTNQNIGVEGLDIFGKAGKLTFEEPDRDKFRTIDLAVEASTRGSTYPAVMNGANEVLVEKFLNSEIGFLDIAKNIEKAMDAHTPTGDGLDDILAADLWAREFVNDNLIREK